MAFHVANGAVVLWAAWDTLSRGRGVIEPWRAGRLASTCLALSLTWIYAAVIGLAPPLRRIGWLQASAAALALLGLVAAAWEGGGGLEDSGPAAPAPAPAAARTPAHRLVLLNFDGADFDTVMTLQAQGKLPAFSRLKEEGAYGRLKAVLPCAAAVTRATLLTGKLPYRHGVRDARARRLLGGGPFIEAVPEDLAFDLLLAPILAVRFTDVSDRRSLAIWDIVRQAPGRGGAAGWEIDLDHRAAGPPGTPRPAQGLLDDLDPEALRASDARSRDLVGRLAAAVEADGRVLEALGGMHPDRGPDVTALSFPGLDQVAHVFLRYARPADFGNLTDREIDLYGPVLERYYRRIDAIVGRALQADGEEATLLFVTSSHGMVPLPPGRRLLAALTSSDGLSGTHQDGPDGFLFARGPQVRRGQRLGKGSIADLVPTALYALDMPVAQDLDGSILAGVFTSRYTFDHPVAVIGSYEERR